MSEEDDFIENDSTDNYLDYESGPFCRHFSDPADCEKKCVGCGHECQDHNYSDGNYSCCLCDCECWVEGE